MNFSTKSPIGCSKPTDFSAAYFAYPELTHTLSAAGADEGDGDRATGFVVPERDDDHDERVVPIDLISTRG